MNIVEQTRISQFLALLRIALYYAVSVVYNELEIAVVCGDYAQFGIILNQSTHKSPHSELKHDTRFIVFPVNEGNGDPMLPVLPLLH